MAIGTYFLRSIPDLKTANTLLLLMAIGAMGVGIITKNYTVAHGAVSSMAFFFSDLAAIASAKVLKKPLSLISIVLGAITLVSLGSSHWASSRVVHSPAMLPTTALLPGFRSRRDGTNDRLPCAHVARQLLRTSIHVARRISARLGEFASDTIRLVMRLACKKLIYVIGICLLSVLSTEFILEKGEWSKKS